jgi:HPt (histidine-containing phosphotransfer) domain-containing protein
MTGLDQRIRAYLAATFHFSDDQIAQMLPSFVDTLRGHLAAVDQAIAGDDGQLAKAAHTLKGALLNLGLEAEVAIALELEERGTDGVGADKASLLSLTKRLREKLAL